jgi:hypothetical protein
MLMGVSVFGQKQKFIIVKTYKNGIATVSKVIPIPVPTPKPVIIPVTKAYKPKIKTVTKTVEVLKYTMVPVPTAPTALDTVAILQRYYPKNVHREVLTLEEGVGNVIITDTISHNRLVSRRWIADIKPKVKERIVEIYRPKTVQWYIGPNFTSNAQQLFLSFGASILRKSLSDNILQISIGTTVHEGIASPTPYFGFGGYIKIK